MAVMALAILAAAAVAADDPACAPPEPAAAQHGRASWYGEGFEGAIMANGQPMDADAPIAAHRRLPLGSRIRVTNLANGRQVELTVTDRGPYVRGRVLDVSQGAAEALGFVEKGTTRVRIEPLACPSQAQGEPPQQ